MAEPEDPQPRSDAAHPHDDFDDDLVGFASPRALSASPVRSMAPPEPVTEPDPPIVAPPPEMTAEAVPEHEPEAESVPPAPIAAPEPPVEPDPVPEPDAAVIEARPEPEPEVEPAATAAPSSEAAADDVFESSEQQPPVVQPPVMQPELDPSDPVREARMETPEPEGPDPEAPAGPEVSALAEVEVLSPRPEAAPTPPAEALATAYGQPGATRSFERRPSRRDPGITADGDARLSLAVYACLVAAAVSVGLTVILALFLAWTGQFLVQGWTRSHLQYQLRTSLVGVIAGIVGVVTFPVGLGVFVLSATVLWVVVRGAAGLTKLLRHEEIRNPRTWKLP
jgi:uncharacterized membrane protein